MIERIEELLCCSNVVQGVIFDPSSKYSEKLLQALLFVWQTVVSRSYSKENSNEVDRSMRGGVGSTIRNTFEINNFRNLFTSHGVKIINYTLHSNLFLSTRTELFYFDAS